MKGLMMLKNFDWKAQFKAFLAKVVMTLFALVIAITGIILVIASN